LNVTIALALIAGFMGAASAQDKSGYWVDASGNLVRGGFDSCIRNADWTPAKALAVCEGGKAPAPAPAPAPMVMNTSVSSDGLFMFGKADLQPKGTGALNDLAAKLKGKKVSKLTVTGHADRLGNEAGNKVLSEKRAAAVKTYLVSKGVDGKVIQTYGVGSSQPRTKADQCKGDAKSAETVACLAADRRVEIQVTYQ
jgi:OOP family OmpA-OmpF porin